MTAFIAMACLMMLGGCAYMSQFDRTYSASYFDEQGHNVGVSVHLKPANSGLAKQ